MRFDSSLRLTVLKLSLTNWVLTLFSPSVDWLDGECRYKLGMSRGTKETEETGKEMEVAREGGLEGKTNAGMRRDGLLNKTETSLLVKDFSVLVHSCSPTPQHQWEEKAICLTSFGPHNAQKNCTVVLRTILTQNHSFLFLQSMSNLALWQHAPTVYPIVYVKATAQWQYNSKICSL